MIECSDALVKPQEMQLVFWPAVYRTRDQSEQILHRQGRTRPVMRFHPGQRDDEVARQSGSGEVEVPFATKVMNALHVIQIQIPEARFKPGTACL